MSDALLHARLIGSAGILLLAATIGGCKVAPKGGSDAGPADGSPLGGPCASNSDCASGLCLKSGLPGGYCSQVCSSGMCPPGALCGEVADQMLCFVDCAHCTRPDYSCLTVSYLGPQACVPSCTLTGTCEEGSPGEEADASSVGNPADVDAGTFGPPGSDAGTLTSVASGLDYPAALTLQAGTMYLALNDGNGSIVGVDLADGGLAEVAPAVDPANLTSDSTHLYWTESGADGGFVMQAALDGTALVTLASVPYTPASLTSDGQSVYWSSPGSNSGMVLSTPVGGGHVTTLATGQAEPVGLFVDGTTLYWCDAAIRPAYPNTGPTTIKNNQGTIMGLSLPGGPLSTLASGQGTPVALSTDSENIYWVNAGEYADDQTLDELLLLPGTGAVVQAAKVGGGSPVTLAMGQDDPVEIAVVAGTLYWLNAGSHPAAGTLETLPLPVQASATGRTLLYSLMHPSAFLVLGSSVYVTDEGTDGLDGTLEELVLPASEP